MKSFGKIIACILCLILSVSTVGLASVNKNYADRLYEIGLFKGTEKGYELDRELTREEAVTTLVRLLGEEKNITENDFDRVFTDVNKDRWSFKYVMYCYENEITKGTGENMFSPEIPITAEEYVTLILRLLGYVDENPETALEACVYYNLLNSDISKSLEKSDEFTRDSMVYIMYRSLMTKTSDGKVLANVLSEKNVITKAQAEEFDIYKSAKDMNELIDKLLG